MLDHHEETHVMSGSMALLDRLKGAAEARPAAPYSLVATMDGYMRAMSQAELEATIEAGQRLLADRFDRLPTSMEQALREPQPSTTNDAEPATTAPPSVNHSTGGGVHAKARRGGKLPYWLKAVDDLDVTKSNGHAFTGSSWRSYPKQRAGDPEGTVYVIGWADFSLAAHEQKIVHAIRKRTGASIEIEIGTHAYTIEDVAFCPKVPLDPRISRGTAAFRQAWSFFARHFNK
jgi:hypothetical protein